MNKTKMAMAIQGASPRGGASVWRRDARIIHPAPLLEGRAFGGGKGLEMQCFALACRVQNLGRRSMRRLVMLRAKPCDI